MTRDEFFTALQNGAKWDIGVSINRTNPVPIDSKSVFQTYELLETYAETDPTAHPGQIVAVVGVSEVSAYLINSTGTGAVIQKLAASSASGDIEQDVLQLQTQVANIINGTQVVARATGDASGNNIKETYATKAVATASTAGLMSATDKTKLDGIAEGAQVNVIEGVAIQTTTDGGYTDLQIVAKKAQLDLSTYATKADLVSIPKFGIEVVATLPTQDISTTTIYLVAQEGEPSGQDIYDEYIYVNSKWELIGNTDIDLSAYSTTVQMNAAIQAAIQALDFTELAVGATKTLGTISQTDGVLTATAVNIAIPHTAITDWDAELAQKQDAIDVEGEGFLKKTSTGFEVDTSTYTTQTQVEGLIETEITALDLANTYLGIGAKAVAAATADKVANAITIGGQTYDGSQEGIVITAATLGALTAVPQATAEALGGIKVGYTTSGNNVAVQLDDGGKAYVAVPTATAYTAGDGLNLAGTEFSIAENGVVTTMISDGAVTDAKITAVNVNKLEQTAGDTLILNGGTAS